MRETYNYDVVRQFAVMTIVWGLVGMLVGVVIAAQLAWPRKRRRVIRGSRPPIMSSLLPQNREFG